MAEREVIVSCYLNGRIKYGPDGVYYEGSIPTKIRVKQKTEFSRLLDGLYRIIGLDKQSSKFEIFGRLPVVVSPQLFRYVHLPVVNDTSLETMLEVPSNHPSIDIVEFYLEVKPTSAIDPAACSSPLENPGSSSKRQRTQQPQEANGYVDMDVTRRHVKLERDNGLEVQGVDNHNGWIEDDANVGSTHGGGDGEMTDKNSGSDGVVDLTGDNDNAHKDFNVPGIEESGNACLNKGVDSSASKPRIMSSLWVDNLGLRVGMCFKDGDELKKAVDWCSIRARKKCVVRETGKDEFMFECIRWKCKWSVWAARMEEDGLVEITKCIVPHTCRLIRPDNFDKQFAEEEIECLIRVQPTLTIAELQRWWFEKFGFELETSEMQEAKKKVIKKIYGDWDQSLRVLPKLMAALQSSNGLIAAWQYDLFPNPEFASFRGVFWAFSQSIEGFRHCRPLIVVDTKDLNGKYPMKLMIAAGLDADNCYFPLAFAVTTKVSSNSWHWFLTGIREKVTQRKGLCLISSPYPDLIAVTNPSGSLWQEGPWAYHRFCLDGLSSRFYDKFKNYRLKSVMKQAGLAKEQDEFDSHMETIKKENPEAREWLDQTPPHQWALAHDSGRRCTIMTINTEALFSLCKSFESLDPSMTAAALLQFDKLRLYFQKGICESRGRLNRGDIYTKPIMDKFEEFRTASVTYVVRPLDNNVFQVLTPLEKDEWTVQLSARVGSFKGSFRVCML